MSDLSLSAAIRSARLDVRVAITTQTCRQAQKAHHLKSSSAIALSRLLTAAVLVAKSWKNAGNPSFQILTKTTLKQLYADVTQEGHVRGFAGNSNLNFPLFAGESILGRRSLAPALLPGVLSVVRLSESGAYTQSSSALTTGEIDTDIEHFLEQSDQIPTALCCDALVDKDGDVIRAGGIMIQALPDGNRQTLETLKKHIAGGALVEALQTHQEASAILSDLAPNAVVVEDPSEIVWKCRCSYDRALRALRMLDPAELAEMIQEGISAQIDCDLCGETYVVPPEEVQKTFKALIRADA